MARFNIEIGAVNAELKKALSESNKLIKQFQKNAQSIKVNIGGGNKRSVDNLNRSLKETDAILKSIAKSATSARTNLRGISGTSSNVSNIQKEREETARLRRVQQELRNEATQLAAATARLRNEQQGYRTEAAKTAAETAKLRLAQQQNRAQTTAAAGSYREAQQRLTALGKEIRNTTGGFTRMTPELQQKIAQYRQLNAQLTQFDRTLGLNHRNIGNYTSVWGRLGQGLATAAAGYLSVFGAIQLASSVVRNNAAISDSLADVQRTAELSQEEARGLFNELKQLGTRTSLGELTQISVIGGQLGIAKDELVGFTEAVDILAVVLANEIPGGAEAVTEALGKINGVFKVAETEGLTAGQAMQKTGSAILALGQAGLATGTFLVDFTQRVAGAARTVGVALPTVLAYGAVLEEAGVSAEVAGTAVSKLIGQLAVRRNEFFAIAQLADASLTLQGFTDLINTDADAALRKFFAGLQAGGKTTTQFYDILGKAKINTERYRNAVLLLSQDQEKLANLTDLSTAEYEKGTKAAEQFELRNTTLGASLAKLTKAFQALTTSGNVSDFLQGFVDGITQSISVLDKLVNSSSWKEFFTRLSGFGNASGNLSTSLAMANIQGDVLRQIQSGTGGGGTSSYVDTFSKQSLSEMERLLKVQEDIVKMRSDTYQSDKSRKNLDELNYQAEILAKIRYEYNLVNAKVKKTGASLEGNNELTKEQLALIEQQRKERERLENNVRKLQEENILNSLSGYEKQVQAIKFRYAEEIKAAKGANDIIQRLEVQRTIAVANAIRGTINAGDSLRASGTSGQVNRGPSSLPSVNLQTQQTVITPDFDLSLITQGLKRASRQFINNMSSSLEWLYQTETKRFGDYLLGIGNAVFSSFDSIINNTLANQLEDTIQGVFDDIKKGVRGGVDWSKIGTVGLGIGGQLLQGATKRTNVLGQTLGGLASGAATGAAAGGWVGAIVGGIIGGLSGLFGASAARRQEKLQEQQLEEQKKQTALMERQAALAYTSQIIGQMTNQGIVQGVSRNEFGDIVFRIQGRDLVGVLSKEETANMRGV